MANEFKPCVSWRQKCHQVIYCHISTTQHFPTVFIAHHLQYLVNKHVQPFLWQKIQHYRAFFQTHNTVFHGIRQFIHLRSLNVQMTNYQLQLPHLWLYCPSSFNVFLLIKWFNQPQWVDWFLTFSRVLFYLPSISTELLVFVSTIILSVVRKNYKILGRDSYNVYDISLNYNHSYFRA